MKVFSPQGTYLIHHRKKRIWKKHWHIANRAKYPEAYEGCKCYIYTNSGHNAYTAKPKQHGCFAESLTVAVQLQEMFKVIY